MQRLVWGAIVPLLLVVAIAAVYANVSVLAGVLLCSALVLAFAGYRRSTRRSRP